MNTTNENRSTITAINEIESPTSLKLRRTQAITNLSSMDEFTPVAFMSAHNSATANKSDTQTCLKMNEINSLGYVEEKKIVIHGIKVRAAKISKLVQILMDSFGKHHLIPLRLFEI